MNREEFIKHKKACMVLTSDHKQIHCDHYARGAEKIVVLAHGFFNSKDSVLLQELGASLFDRYDVALLDFRGHGNSPGLFSWTTKEHMDLTAVLEFLKPHYQKIGVIGFSLGAAITIITATKIDWIDSIIAVSGPSDFDKIDYHFWELDAENDLFYNMTGDGRAGKGIRPGPFWLKKEKPINKVSEVKCPALFVHGENDWVIKPWHSQALFEKAQCKKEIVVFSKGPHAEYLMRKNKEETVDQIRNWFEETL